MNEHYLISPAIELVSPKFKADKIHTFWLVYKIYGMLYHSAPGGFPSVQATAFHRQWCISWLKEEEIGSHRITNAEEIDSQLSTKPALECFKYTNTEVWKAGRFQCHLVMLRIHTWDSGPIVMVQCLEIETFVRCSTSQSDTPPSVDATPHNTIS